MTSLYAIFNGEIKILTIVKCVTQFLRKGYWQFITIYLIREHKVNLSIA